MTRTRAITILFCDLVASTERRARLGDDRFDEFTERFMRTLRSAIADHNGREVHTAGDGLMAVFPESVADALSCAQQMHESIAALEPDDPAQLRIGISTGEVAEDGDDYQGMPIVEAARLEGAAAPGHTLTTAIVRSLVGTRRGLQFRDVGSLTLKGLPPLLAVEVVGVAVADVTRPTSAAARARAVQQRGRTLAALAALAVAVVLAGVLLLRGGDDTSNDTGPGVSAPEDYTPVFADAPCPEDILQAAPDATCGTLDVPQDRGNPDGRHIKLSVERTPARVANPAPIPSIDVCGCENPASSVARDHAELIRMTARGGSGTDPAMTCPELTAAVRHGLAKRSDDPDANAEVLDAVAACRDQVVARGIDPAQYNAQQAALDFLDLMVALRLRTADFIANGDNDIIVFAVLRQAPGAVRSITLDNPPPPGASSLRNPVRDLEGAYTRYVGLCNADSVCARGYPDLLDKVKQLATSLAESGAETLEVAPPDDPNGTPIPILVDYQRAADALRVALSDSSIYGVIPSVLYAPFPDPVVGDTLLGKDPFLWDDDAPWVGLLSYTCSYQVHTADPNPVALSTRIFPHFVSRFDQWVKWCETWDVPDLSERLSVAVASPVPVLMFRGDISPHGTSDWIDSLLRGLPNARSAIFPTLGEDLLTRGPPCLSDLRRRFLANPGAPLDTDACIKAVPPVAFVPPS